MDAASAGLGFGAGKLLDKGIEQFGLEAAESSSTRGMIGRIFGAYGPKYVAQHAAGIGVMQRQCFILTQYLLLSN